MKCFGSGVISGKTSLAPDSDSKFKVPDKCKGKQVGTSPVVWVTLVNLLQFVGGSVPVKANLGISYAGTQRRPSKCSPLRLQFEP